MTYSIGEIASMLSIPPSTLRYYDKEGLLPFVARSEGGQRIFDDSDYEKLKIIECLKKAGMPIKEIRRFITLYMEGDATIDQRLAMIINRQEAVTAKIEEMKITLEALAYKRWYYELAKKAGTISMPRDMSEEELPVEFRRIR
ncbi:MAG: MerR family transcriptional regulator, partial [Bacillota bacterium]|nr:MerR family transcriptional regulator [Bacillota bacterium]